MSTIKPMIILPPGNMSDENIAVLRENGICVVVSEKPEQVKFVDAVAAVSSRTQIENAAIKLSRFLLTAKNDTGGSSWNMSNADIAKRFVELIVQGTPLDPEGTIQEREEKLYDHERAAEVRRIACEDARNERAERAAKKKKA